MRPFLGINNISFAICAGAFLKIVPSRSWQVGICNVYCRSFYRHVSLVSDSYCGSDLGDGVGGTDDSSRYLYWHQVHNSTSLLGLNHIICFYYATAKQV